MVTIQIIELAIYAGYVRIAIHRLRLFAENRCKRITLQKMAFKLPQNQKELNIVLIVGKLLAILLFVVRVVVLSLGAIKSDHQRNS